MQYRLCFAYLMHAHAYAGMHVCRASGGGGEVCISAERSCQIVHLDIYS